MNKVGVCDEQYWIGYGEGVTTGWGDGITNTESPIKIGGCTKELSIGGGTKSEGYLD